MTTAYSSAPIEEAVCAIHLPQTVNWDMTVPGAFYEKIKANYPEDILDQLNSLASLFEEPLSERDGWILITTDFSQPG
jgi:uncharacterized protein (TIGR04255 family)